MAEYRDPSHIDLNKEYQITELAKFIREKMYGIDTREAMALALERVYKDASKNGNANMEVSEARGDFSLLKDRMNSVDEKLTNLQVQKTDRSYVDAVLTSIAAGGPKELFYSLNALKAKYPNGAEGVFLVFDSELMNGAHSYMWKENVWTDLGPYQGAEIKDGSITNKKIRSVSANQVLNTDVLSWLPYEQSNADIINYNEVTGGITLQLKSDASGNTGIRFSLNRTDEKAIYVYFSSVQMTTDYVTIALAKDGNRVYTLKILNNSIAFPLAIKVTDKIFTDNEIEIGEPYEIWIYTSANMGKSVYLKGLQITYSKELLGVRNVSDAVEKISDLQYGDMLRGPNDYETLLPSGWFDSVNAIYEENDGVYEIGYSGGSPGIRIDIPENLLGVNYRYYLICRAKKVTGENAGFRTRILNLTPIKEISENISIKLSQEWQFLCIPLHFLEKNSLNATNDASCLLQILSDSSFKIVIDNPRLIATNASNGNVLLDLLKENCYQESLTEYEFGLRKGEYPDFDKINPTKENVSDYFYVTPKSNVGSDDVYLKNLEIYLEKAATVKFKIGGIDQYNLIVTRQEFSVTGKKGLNIIDMSDKDILIPPNYRVFMDISGQNILYDYTAKTEKSLVQDSTHTIDENGYSGMTMYETGKVIPFSYTVSGMDNRRRINAADKKAEDALKKIEDTGPADEVILTSESGKKFRLKIADDGTVQSESVYPKNVLSYANSLVWGFGTFGMCATSSQKDYYHLLETDIKNNEPTATIKKVYGSPWEHAENSADRLAQLNDNVLPELNADTDLVLIQLGDNINTDAKKATFYEDAVAMIGWFKKNAPKAQIIWVANWYNTAFSYPKIVQAAAQFNNVKVCNITDLGALVENQGYIGMEYTDDNGVVKTVSNSGVASHPGNAGHRIIADRVKKMLGM